MKLLVLSDLHFEFEPLTPPTTEADVVVLPGDIWTKDNGIYWARQTWPDKPIIYVSGNHEFYRTERTSMLNTLRISAREADVHFLENDEVVLDGVRFLGCSLWTDFELFGRDMRLDCIREGRDNLNDFRLIFEGPELFTPSDSVTLFNESKAWLSSKLNEKFEGKTVVVTHHLPSMRSVAPQYSEDLLSACFASNLDELLGLSEVWIHGHTHTSFDYLVEGTRVVCNPRGYVQKGKAENPDFNPSLVVDLNRSFTDMFGALRGTVVSFDNLTEPVGEDDWED
jgi:predicted phosphodiesterase